jgi:hypothetical protein
MVCWSFKPDLTHHLAPPEIHCTPIASIHGRLCRTRALELDITKVMVPMTNWWKPTSSNFTELLKQVLDMQTFCEIIHTFNEIDDIIFSEVVLRHTRAN